MVQKTVIINKYNEPLDVKSDVCFCCVIQDNEEPLTEQTVNVEYDSLTAEQKVKIDEALTVLEEYIPA